MKNIGEYLTSESGKIVGFSALLIIFIGVYGFILGRMKALKNCVDPYDFTKLPTGGNGLGEVKQGGSVVKAEFTVENARIYARKIYDMWETYNPFKKSLEDGVAREILALNDDELVLTCRAYIDAYSETVFESITDDYWGLTNWVDDLLDTNTGKLVKRLEKLKQT